MATKHTNQPIYHDGGRYEGVIKGHFWIERDGNIIDYDFPEYENGKLSNMCYGDKQYKRATKARRSAMKRLAINEKFQELKAMKESPENSLDRIMYEELVKSHPIMDHCATNVCIEKLERGGTIIYGDMGWKTKLERSDIYWEYEDKRTTESVRADFNKMTHEEKMNYAKYNPQVAPAIQRKENQIRQIKHITRVVEKLGGTSFWEEGVAFHINCPDDCDEEKFQRAVVKEMKKIGWDMNC